MTANLYCANHLNEVVFHVVRPAWRRFKEEDPENLWQLWFMRYGKGGEHLKIRAHGPAEGKALLADLLARSAEAFFSSLEPPGDARQPGRWKGAPPIDAQDRVSSDHPDRSLLWTDYGRSHISLGGKPLLLDDGYVSRMTECLAQAAEIALKRIEPDAVGTFPHQRRQSTLLASLMASLAALGFTSEQRTAYLHYHRDCLLRFLLLKSEDPFEKARETLHGWHLRVEKMESSFQMLKALARERWEQGRHAESAEDSEAAWGRALVRLHGYVAPLCQNPDFHLDPFSPDPAFAPLFKAIHGLANHLGIGLPDEAFAHHLLLLATDPGDERVHRVALLPE